MTLVPRRQPFRAFTLVVALSASVLGWGAHPAHAQEADTWKEAEAIPPASFNAEKLQTFDVDSGSTLTYGIDPNNLTVGSDGVVRYVLVARSRSGALNVLYQGLRCQTAQVKTYARWDNKDSWNTDDKADWLPLMPRGFTQPAMTLARAGICDGRTVNGSAQTIIRTLKNGRPKHDRP